MKIAYVLILLPFLLAEIASAAEMYRWVDADGKVHYTDTRPPTTAKSAQKKELGSQAGKAQISGRIHGNARTAELAVSFDRDLNGANKFGMFFEVHGHVFPGCRIITGLVH